MSTTGRPGGPWHRPFARKAVWARPIRFGHLDAPKKLAEYEDQIRAGTVDRAALARDVFQTVAHRRTGDTEIDNKCTGPSFNDDEVAMLDASEMIVVARHKHG